MQISSATLASWGAAVDNSAPELPWRENLYRGPSTAASGRMKTKPYMLTFENLARS